MSRYVTCNLCRAALVFGKHCYNIVPSFHRGVVFRSSLDCLLKTVRSHFVAVCKSDKVYILYV